MNKESTGLEASALAAAAAKAVSDGQFRLASELLTTATLQEPNASALWTQLAATHRALQDLPGALAAVERAIEIDPRSFLALLMKGSLLERVGDLRKAAIIYGAALTQAPPEQILDGNTRRALSRAREVNEKHRDDLLAHVQQNIGTRRDSVSTAEARRIDQFVATTLGLKRNFRQEPSDFFYPGLPAIEFWDRDEFPWLAELEASTEAIRAEAQAALVDDDGLTPYIAYDNGRPLDQWAELNHSSRWSAFHFHHFGQRYDANAQRCPNTIEALMKLPQPQVRGRMPAAMYSVLRAGTRIPPHTGVANVRLVLHLPLIVPPGCGFRVGNETREWRAGEAWVFDDTIEHEAWNLGDRDRVVLICDLWNPRISAAERELIASVMIAMDDYNGFVPTTASV